MRGIVPRGLRVGKPVSFRTVVIGQDRASDQLIAPVGYAFLVRSDGTYLVNANGAFLIVSRTDDLPTLPPGYSFATRADGSYILNTNNDYITVAR